MLSSYGVTGKVTPHFLNFEVTKSFVYNKLESWQMTEQETGKLAGLCVKSETKENYIGTNVTELLHTEHTNWQGRWR